MTDKIFRGIGYEEFPLHHAYLIEADIDEAINDILVFLEKVAWLEMRGNPDLYVERFGLLSVDDSRRIKDIASKKPLGKRKAMILAFNSATVEAQNALLKVLEEPSDNTHLFLIVPKVELIVPTLLSRVFVIESNAGKRELPAEYAKKFIMSGIADRLDISKDISQRIADGKLDKNFVSETVGEIEILMWNRDDKHSLSEIFKDIDMCKKYLSDRSASVKMLLDHLALVLPMQKP